MAASPDFCASAHKLPETALDSFNQCNGFNFFAWLFIVLAPRDNKFFPFVPGGGSEGGGGDGTPGGPELDKFPGCLVEGNGGGGAEGMEGKLLASEP